MSLLDDHKIRSEKKTFQAHILAAHQQRAAFNQQLQQQGQQGQQHPPDGLYEPVVPPKVSYIFLLTLGSIAVFLLLHSYCFGALSWLDALQLHAGATRRCCNCSKSGRPLQNPFKQVIIVFCSQYFLNPFKQFRLRLFWMLRCLWVPDRG